MPLKTGVILLNLFTHNKDTLCYSHSMFITNFIFGLLIVAIGVVMLKFNFQVSNMFSHNNVFERYMGSGATYFVMQVMSVLAVIFGLLMMFSLHDNLLSWLTSPLRNLISF